MPWVPTLLEDSLDPWLAIEPDRARRRAVLEFLVELCDTGGRTDGAIAVRGTQLPTFAAAVPGSGVVIVWVIAERYEQLAFRYLIDIERDLRFGG